jgi:hypothetical protein
LSLFDHLWNESPMVKKMKEESEARGKAIGEARGKAIGQAIGQAIGEVGASQRMLVSVVRTRFPSLTDLAQQTAAQMDNVEGIEHLVQQIITAKDENTARWLLCPTAA